jgi:hypothetical protein
MCVVLTKIGKERCCIYRLAVPDLFFKKKGPESTIFYRSMFKHQLITKTHIYHGKH